MPHSTHPIAAPAPFVRSPENLGGAFVAGQTSLVVEHEEAVMREADHLLELGPGRGAEGGGIGAAGGA